MAKWWSGDQRAVIWLLGCAIPPLYIGYVSRKLRITMYDEVLCTAAEKEMTMIIIRTSCVSVLHRYMTGWTQPWRFMMMLNGWDPSFPSYHGGR